MSAEAVVFVVSGVAIVIFLVLTGWRIERTVFAPHEAYLKALRKYVKRLQGLS